MPKHNKLFKISERNNAIKDIYYFAYGMLTNSDLITTDAEFVGVAVLHNFKFELCMHANVVPNDNKHVKGVLWRISAYDLSYLDQIEGYPQYYTRITRPVFVNGNIYNAEIYIMTDDSRNRSKKSTPSMYYIDNIRTGYDRAGIDTHQLNSAVAEFNLA